MKARQIRTEELDLIRHLLNVANDKIERQIPNFVIDMEDGEMRSLKFESNQKTTYQSDLIQVKYIDTDSVDVFITLTLNNKNELFELDIWKTDFEKLIKFPKPTEVIIQ